MKMIIIHDCPLLIWWIRVICDWNRIFYLNVWLFVCYKLWFLLMWVQIKRELDPVFFNKWIQFSRLLIRQSSINYNWQLMNQFSFIRIIWKICNFYIVTHSFRFLKISNEISFVWMRFYVVGYASQSIGLSQLYQNPDFQSLIPWFSNQNSQSAILETMIC